MSEINESEMEYPSARINVRHSIAWVELPFLDLELHMDVQMHMHVFKVQISSFRLNVICYWASKSSAGLVIVVFSMW